MDDKDLERVVRELGPEIDLKKAFKKVTPAELIEALRYYLEKRSTFEGEIDECKEALMVVCVFTAINSQIKRLSLDNATTVTNRAAPLFVFLVNRYKEMKDPNRN